MQESRIFRLRKPRVRRFVSLLTLVAYFVVCTGIPLPFVLHSAAASGDVSAAPYPCQGHRCGCRSAEQCWKACCCMSDMEKRIWAERNGVALPDYLRTITIPTPAAPIAEAACEHDTAPVRSCCKKMSGRSPKKVEVASPVNCTDCKSSNATQPAELNATASSSKHEAARKSETHWISYVAAQRCSGGATDAWLNGPIGLPAAPPVHCLGLRFDTEEFSCVADPALSSAFLSLLERPPRWVLGSA